jgi:hypothetical protein
MPVITISRMFGAGGSEVAAAVARALRWTLLDNAFVERVAIGLHTTPAYVQAIEERVPSMAERIADTFASVSQEMLAAPMGAPLPPTEERLLEATHRVIDEAVARGPVVLVGRGAQAWLHARDDALHVLCVSTRDACIARVAARESLPSGEVARLVDETNKRRAEYVKRHWNRDWLAPANYHLCIDTSAFGIEGAVELVVSAARRRGIVSIAGIGNGE